MTFVKIMLITCGSSMGEKSNGWPESSDWFGIVGFPKTVCDWRLVAVSGVPWGTNTKCSIHLLWFVGRGMTCSFITSPLLSHPHSASPRPLPWCFWSQYCTCPSTSSSWKTTFRGGKSGQNMLKRRACLGVLVQSHFKNVQRAKEKNSWAR